MRISFYSKCFLALCVCTALLACSEETPDPTHADLCKNGVSVECLLGSWKLDAIEKKSGEIHTRDIGGTLTFSRGNKNNSYEFKSLELPHYGTWNLDSDNNIVIDCIDGDFGCPSNQLGHYKIKVDIGGNTLWIYEAPFSDYFEIENPTEKYQFLP